MKTSLLPKLLSFALALLLLASVTASGSMAFATDAQDATEKYDPPITVKMAYTPDSNIPYAEGESATDNRWLNGYRDELGINIEYAWQATGDVATQKLDLAIASGSMPDIMLATAKQFELLLKEDLIQPLDEAFENHLTPLAREVLTEDGGFTLETGTKQDQLMGISGIPFVVESSYNWWVRLDWLEKLGLEEPETYEDLLAIAEAFATQDPDGNGKDDTLGILVSNTILESNNLANIDGILSAFHAYMNIWVKDETGNLVYSGIQPEMRTGLLELQRLVQAGLISKEFSMTDGNKVAELLSSGQAGLECGAWWNEAWPLNGSYENDPTAEWKAFALVSADDQPAKPKTGMSDLSYYVVRKGYEHPEALMKLINFFVDKEYSGDPEGAKYMRTEDGQEIYKASLVTIWRGDENVHISYPTITEALATGDPSNLTPSNKDYYDRILAYEAGDTSVMNWVAVHHYGPMSALDIYVDYRDDRSKMMVNEFYGSQTETMATKWATLTKLQSENIFKIMSGADISEFDSFVENWKSLGGDQITQEVNDWYAASK